MADVFTATERSRVMAAIRCRGNKATELAMIALFRRHGIIGWRRNARVFGKPDFVFRRQRVAVFVDGCFWHCCPLHANLPANNRAFWRGKLAANRRRDRLVTHSLRKAGWRVVRIWEHDLKRGRHAAVLRRIRRALDGA
jgi:DNA mismatch endonuclease (patch repair protein)